jgi:hypothetical protein
MSRRVVPVAEMAFALVALLLISGDVALAQSYRALHTFVLGNVNDGAQPFAGLIQATTATSTARLAMGE